MPNYGVFNAGIFLNFVFILIFSDLRRVVKLYGYRIYFY
jgi:hypothetical protein